MSDDFEPALPEQTIAEVSHRRILILMGILIAAGSLAGAIFLSFRFGIGVFMGGLLSFLNYFWLKSSLKAIFTLAVESEGEKPRLKAFGYILRYVVFGGIVGLIYLSQAIPILAVIAGLGSFAMAVVIEGFLRIFTTVFNKKDI